MGCCTELSALHKKISYDEVLGAWYMPRKRLADCFCTQKYQLVVYAVERPMHGPPCRWSLAEHKLTAPSLEVAKEWVATISAALALCHDRPRNLLVFLNPFSGAKRARQVWEGAAMPIFQRARIKYAVVETQAPDHARDMLASMKADELAQYQGVVAVGGDGVFQECMIGLLAQRARGGAHAAVAARIRLGHIPGGSTDAVAFSLHGTRSVESAALHIALGDRLSLDVARVECDPSLALSPPSCQPRTEMAWKTGDGKAGSAGAAAAGAGANARASPGDEPGSQGAGSQGAAQAGAPPGQLSPLASPTAATPMLPVAGATSSDAAMSVPHSTSSLGSASSVKHGPSSKLSLPPGKAQQGGAGGAAGDGAGGLGAGACGQPPAYKHFVCQAAYGFLGDVMRFSEGLRFLGPSRYDVAGFIQFLRLKSYKLHISYKRAAQHMQADTQRVCSHRCESCRLAGINLMQRSSQDEDQPPSPAAASRSAPNLVPTPNPSQAVLGMLPGTTGPPSAGTTGQGGGGGGMGACAAPPAAGAGPCSALLEGVGGEWVHEDGEYISVMAVVTPCRSDRSKRGIIPHAHLADGRIYLVLVSRCSHVDYLRFLLRLSSHGLEDGCFPFVRVVPVSALAVRPAPGAEESCWNVDGELLPSNAVRMRVARGLVDVFARGVELVAPHT